MPIPDVRQRRFIITKKDRRYKIPPIFGLSSIACLYDLLAFRFDQSVCISFSLINYIDFFRLRIAEYKEVMSK